MRKVQFRESVGKLWLDIHQSYFVVVLCVGTILGMVLGIWLRVNFFASPVWTIFALILLFLGFLKPKIAFLSLALVAGMVLAFFRVANELTGENYIRQFYGEAVLVTGVVDGDPNTDEKGTKIKLKNLKFGEGGMVAGSIYLTLRENSEIKRADELTVSGKLSEGFGAYAGYIYKPTIEKVARAEPGDLVLGIRNWFAERVRKLVPETEANLGLSYLLGMRSGLTEEFSENLRTVGLVHIVVASGAHLSILVETSRKIFGKISRFAGLLFSILFILFFMALVGWTPSIMRAGVMAILTVVAWYVGRKFAPWRIILIVMAMTLMMNPMYLINLGWLLSFASYAGIMILGPKIIKMFYGKKQPGLLASVVITTLAATIMTLPISLYYFGTVSLISVVANLLILPTLPYAMGVTFLAGVVSGVPFLENIVAWLATKLLDFHILVVEFFGEMKSFLIQIDANQWWVWLIYLAILAWIVGDFVRRRILLSREKVVKLREVEE